MGYKTCPYCGAHLDPGETCDCRDEAGGGVQPGRKEDYHKTTIKEGGEA